MPQETLGYVEMEWTCRRCGTKNKGLTKTCANCGAQMEAEQQFEKPAEQQLIDDQAKLAQAGKGADVHCPFCGTRNAADATVCSQCGGDLTKAQKREAGQVVGAYQPGVAAPPVVCPACQTQNPAGAANCQSCGRPLGATAAATPPAAAPPRPVAARPAQPNWILAAVLGVVGLLCLCGVGFLVLQSLNTTDVVGVVQAVRWERSISIEARAPVEREAWRDQVPADAQLGVCRERPRELRDAPDPARRSDQVCGTPYTVDQGDGTGRVVQDCQYQVYDEYCAYSVLEWRAVDRVEASGNDLRPVWPPVSLRDGQREGSRAEQYAVSFSADGQTYDYSPSGEAEFMQFDPGSRWTLKINGLGGLNGVEPAP